MKKVILLMLIVVSFPCLLRAQQKKVVAGQVSVAPLYPLIIKNKLTLSSPVFASVFSAGGSGATSSTSTTSNATTTTSSSSSYSGSSSVTPKATSPVGPRDYYQQSFGYFCKREWTWEKQTKVPVKFRLGSYQEAQRIEGKQ